MGPVDIRQGRRQRNLRNKWEEKTRNEIAEAELNPVIGTKREPFSIAVQGDVISTGNKEKKRQSMSRGRCACWRLLEVTMLAMQMWKWSGWDSNRHGVEQ